MKANSILVFRTEAGESRIHTALSHKTVYDGVSKAVKAGKPLELTAIDSNGSPMNVYIDTEDFIGGFSVIDVSNLATDLTKYVPEKTEAEKTEAETIANLFDDLLLRLEAVVEKQENLPMLAYSTDHGPKFASEQFQEEVGEEYEVIKPQTFLTLLDEWFSFYAANSGASETAVATVAQFINYVKSVMSDQLETQQATEERTSEVESAV